MLSEYEDNEPERVVFISPREKVYRRTDMTDNKIKLSDVGTRYKHWTELLELWQVGLDVLNRYNFDSDNTKKTQLAAAITLLQKQMDVASGYDFKGWDMRDAINSISVKPETIKGGRGTPLKHTYEPGTID